MLPLQRIPPDLNLRNKLSYLLSHQLQREEKKQNSSRNGRPCFAWLTLTAVNFCCFRLKFLWKTFPFRWRQPCVTREQRSITQPPLLISKLSVLCGSIWTLIMAFMLRVQPPWTNWRRCQIDLFIGRVCPTELIVVLRVMDRRSNFLESIFWPVKNSMTLSWNIQIQSHRGGSLKDARIN